MTIRKNECRSNTPVRGAHMAEGAGKNGDGRDLGGGLLPRLPHWPALLQVNLVSCDGRCPSASIYNHNINTYARFCKCCREVGLQRRSVQLFCATNATWVPYTVQEPTDCACQWS
jgi:hypothetical protein